ncbi:hypothetical protein [Prauserella flavalba]|uniref:Uncharacterized protein n=1 Tax=Prauserella flavalba TaxID=1477506 RepID=A0A318LRU4_9PSEU|nr:hypothetical protein [Prauserella flavalba]PXY37332.1 hypothetical protein BA062_06245 [Prauserella flavalba]
MSIARKDDRHNDDLVREIADGFNRAVGPKPEEGEEAATEKPRFVVTGDMRNPPKPGRDKRL